MKQLIKDVLKDLSKGQVNLGSESAREMVATAIMSAIRTSDKGWFLDLNPSTGDKVFNQAVFGDSRDLTEAKIQANSDHNDGWTKQYYKDKLSEAIVDNKTEKYIYESPDGGKTVYRRKFNDPWEKRELMDKEEWEKQKKSV